MGSSLRAAVGMLMVVAAIGVYSGIAIFKPPLEELKAKRQVHSVEVWSASCVCGGGDLVNRMICATCR